MKPLKLLILTILLVVSSTSFAAAAKPGRRPASADRAKRSAPVQNGRYKASIVYSFANAFRYEGQVDMFGTPTAFTATDQRTGAAGFSLGYEWRKASSFGFEASATYELPRASKGLSGTAGEYTVTGTWSDPPKTAVAVATLNGNYSFGKSAYVFAGTNYPLPTGDSSAEAEFSGLPGYQAGGGYVFTRSWSAEAAYRSIRIKGRFKTGTSELIVEKADISGFLLNLNYLF